MSNAMIATKKREKKSSNETKESVTKKRFWATRTIIASPIITTMQRTNPVSSARKRMSVQRYALFPCREEVDVFRSCAFHLRTLSIDTRSNQTEALKQDTRSSPTRERLR